MVVNSDESTLPDLSRRPVKCQKFKALFLSDFFWIMAGVVGFEPTIHGTKNRCLTAWLHPNSDALITLDLEPVQGPKPKKSRFSVIGVNLAFHRAARPTNGPFAPSLHSHLPRLRTSRHHSWRFARSRPTPNARWSSRCLVGATVNPACLFR